MEFCEHHVNSWGIDATESLTCVVGVCRALRLKDVLENRWPYDGPDSNSRCASSKKMTIRFFPKRAACCRCRNTFEGAIKSDTVSDFLKLFADTLPQASVVQERAIRNARRVAVDAHGKGFGASLAKSRRRSRSIASR